MTHTMTMPEFYDVLFEVSSETRYKIMTELRTQNVGITHISNSLSISQAEASRHFRRLTQTGIIEKDPKGLYRITNFGDMIFRLLKPFSFVSKHYDYFRNRDLSSLPHQFISRLYELEKSEANYQSRANIFRLQEKITRVGPEAEEYVNVILDEEMTNFTMYNLPNPKSVQNFTPTSKPNVHFRAILPSSFDPDKIPEPLRSKYVELVNNESREYRSCSDLSVILHSSEKEMPVLSFLSSDGEYDYLGFEATDEDSIKWNKDLFEYYWRKAYPISFI
jgi:predicted transcriptional regulator